MPYYHSKRKHSNFTYRGIYYVRSNKAELVEAVEEEKREKASVKGRCIPRKKSSASSKPTKKWRISVPFSKAVGFVIISGFTLG